jgi:hypothetical protein
MSRSPIPVLLALLAVPTAPVGAQSAAPPPPPGRAVGATVDRVAVDEGPLVITVHVSSMRPNRLGPELGIGLVPRALAYRALVLTPDLGAALDLALPGADLLLKGGASAIVGLGPEAAIYPGYHFGAAALIRAAPAMGLRVDLMRRTYLVPDGRPTFWTIGVGFSSLPRQPRRE